MTNSIKPNFKTSGFSEADKKVSIDNIKRVSSVLENGNLPSVEAVGKIARTLDESDPMIPLAEQMREFQTTIEHARDINTADRPQSSHRPAPAALRR